MAEVECAVSLGHDIGGDDEFRLLEADASILELLKSQPKDGSGDLCLKGDLGGDVVLCSGTTTHQVQSLESTNLLLLGARTDAASRRMEARVSQTFELLRCPGRVHKLDELLRDGAFDEQDAAAGATQTDSQCRDEPSAKRRRTYTTSELASVVQASAAELTDALSKSAAVQIDGRWRTVSKPLLDECFESLIRVGDSCFDLASFTWAEVDGALGDLHDPVVVSCTVNKYCRRLDQTDPAVTEQTRFALDTEKAAVHRAEELLTAQSLWDCDAFMEQWRAISPCAIKPDISWLRGEVIIRQLAPVAGSSQAKSTLRHYPKDALPRQPAKRFEQLFRENRQWRREDLVPFLEPIAGPGQTLQQLLDTHTRQFNVDGVQLHSPFW